MLTTRTQFRITLGGGGTDLPGYYSKHGGFVLAAALNKCMFIYLLNGCRRSPIARGTEPEVNSSRLEDFIFGRQLG